MDGLEDSNEVISILTQNPILMAVPQVFNEFRQAVQLHGLDDRPVRREVIYLFGTLHQLDAALQDLDVDGDICDIVVEPKTEGVDDVVSGEVGL